MLAIVELHCLEGGLQVPAQFPTQGVIEVERKYLLNGQFIEASKPLGQDGPPP